jgi:hypothetical protein
MQEFIVTKGDIYILPYLNKSDKAKCREGKQSKSL